MQARLKEAESQCALKEMQDKILDMEKVGYLRHDALLQACFFTSIYICCCSFKTYNPYTPSLEEHISTR